MFILSAIAFCLLLTVLILIHEWGHYYAAKKSGVIVEEFGFGLPPVVKTLFTYDGTRFTLNWVPFGGFVRLKGENAIEPEEHMAPGSFGSASVGARIVILCAGVFMNFLLAIIILTFGFSLGKWIPTYQSVEEMKMASQKGVINLELGVRIDEVISGGGAAKVGVPKDSIIVAVDGNPVSESTQIGALQVGKREVVYTLLTGKATDTEESFTIPLDPEGKAGVVIATFPKVLSADRRGVFTAFGLSMRESWIMMKQTVIGIGSLFTSLASSGSVPDEISGIVGIAQYTHVSVQKGFMAYLKLVALLSLSLAAINILPFPALDGGRLMFVLAEAISRKPVNRKFELVTNGVGFVFLILLIILITYNDISRLF